VLPFLALGMGVDDLFVIAFAFREVRERTPLKLRASTVPQQVGTCMAIAGSSVTLTSIANFAAFLAGSLVPLPAVRSFCQQAAIDVAFNYTALMLGMPGLLAIHAHFSNVRGALLHAGVPRVWCRWTVCPMILLGRCVVGRNVGFFMHRKDTAPDCLPSVTVGQPPPPSLQFLQRGPPPAVVGSVGPAVRAGPSSPCVSVLPPAVVAVCVPAARVDVCTETCCCGAPASLLWSQHACWCWECAPGAARW